MIPVWLIAAIALLGAVCLALPLHIGMTGVCLLLLAAVLLALRILRKKNAPKVWSRILIALTAVSMAVIFGAMGYISVQGKDSAMTPDETPDFIVVLGAQVQGDGPSLTLKKRLDKALEFLQAHPDRTVIVSGGQGRTKRTRKRRSWRSTCSRTAPTHRRSLRSRRRRTRGKICCFR